MRRRSFPAALGALALLALAFAAGSGCGGSGSRSAAGSSRAIITVVWPQETRKLPLTAAKVVAEVYLGNMLIATSPPAFRSTAENSSGDVRSRIEIENLPPHKELRFDLKAYAFRIDGPRDYEDPNSYYVDPKTNEQVPVAFATFHRTLKERENDLTDPNTGGGLVVAMGTTVVDFKVKTVDTNAEQPFTLTPRIGSLVNVFVEAYDSQGRLVLLQYNPENPNANPQIQWQEEIGPAGAFGLSLNDQQKNIPARGLQVKVSAATVVAGSYLVKVSYHDPNETAAVRSETFRFDITRLTPDNLPDEGALSTLSFTTSQPLIDVAARVGAFGDDVFLLAAQREAPVFSQVTVAPSGESSGGRVLSVRDLSVQNPTPTSQPLPLIAIGRYADTTGFIGTDGTKVYKFALYPANSENLGILQAADYTGTGTVVDVDTVQSQSAPYVLYRPSAGGALTLQRLDANFVRVDKNNHVDQSATRLAVFKEAMDTTPTFFVSTGAGVFRYQGDGGLAQVMIPIPNNADPNSIVQNPSREEMGTVVDIACDVNFLYVLSDTSKGGRVHIFDAQTLSYSRSRKIDDDRSRRILGLAAGTGKNSVYVAYQDAQNRAGILIINAD